MKRKWSTAVTQEHCVSPTLKRTKVLAQRKFAQGFNNYTYASPKVVSKTSDGFNTASTPQVSSPENEECELNTFSCLPTVDDFLTFLCFRETEVLPNRLNYLNSPQFDALIDLQPPPEINGDSVPSNRKPINCNNYAQKKQLNKENTSLKNKKLIKYKQLRSRNLTTATIPKTARSIALKLNQRLRSKSVVPPKICESKSKTIKEKILPKLVPGSKRAIKSADNAVRSLPIKKSIPKVKKLTKPVSPVRRVTRQNVFLNRICDIPLEITKKPKTISPTPKSNCSSASKKMTITLEDAFPNIAEIAPPGKCKSNVTNSTASTPPAQKKNITVTKPVTRSTRCNDLGKEPIEKPSSPSLQSPKTPTKNTRINGLNLKKTSMRTLRTSSTNSAEKDHDAPTDDSQEEPVLRSSRPPRRTKEAATLYMELLGKELLCPDRNYDDDDNFSIDSFPELPNTEEHLRRERELKEQFEKSAIKKSSISKKIDVQKTKPETDQITPKAATSRRGSKNLDEKTKTHSDGETEHHSKTSNSESDNKVSTRRNSQLSVLKEKPTVKTKEPEKTSSDIEVTITDFTKRQKSNKKIFKKSVLPTKMEIVQLEEKSPPTQDVARRVSIETEKNLPKETVENVENHSSVRKVRIETEKSLPKETVKNVENHSSVRRVSIETEKSPPKETTKNVENHSSMRRVSIETGNNLPKETMKNVENHSSARRVSIETGKNLPKERLKNVENHSSVKSPRIDSETIRNTKSERKLVKTKSSTRNEHEESVCSCPQPDITEKSATVESEVESVEEITTPTKTDLSRSLDMSENKIFRKSKTEFDRKCEAFSADNEKSVYAFEPEPPTTSPPFRRLKPITPTKTSIGNSIAVQVNFGKDVKLECSSTKNSEISTSDCGSDRVFYIPIQTSTATTSSLGVAVKLGTDGPNQKIIMSATLITNTPTFSTMTATTVSTKTSTMETNTKMMRLSNKEQPAVKKSHPSTVSEEKKTSSESDQEEVPKNQKNQGPSVTKQSVKILKLNKNKRTEMVNQSTNTEEPQVKVQSSDLKSDIVKNRRNSTNKSIREVSKERIPTKETSTRRSSSPIPKKVDSTGPVKKVLRNHQEDEEIDSSATSSSSLSKSTTNKTSIQSVKIVKVIKNKRMESSSRSSDRSSPVPSTSNAAPKVNEVENKKMKTDHTKAKVEVVTKARPSKCKSTKSQNSENKPASRKSSSATSNGEILKAPTFHPTEEEFSDPLEFIESIRPMAEKFGLCRIVPPSNFRPECKVADEMRFTAYNQYVHKMLHRWGPNVKEFLAIKKFLATQNIQLTQSPWIGGMEVDLPRLYQTVQQCGGLSAVIEKERWQMVADTMRIPKLAQDRITKLDDIYCKYLLPYDILSQNERDKLFEEIEKEWEAHLKEPIDDELFEDVDECIVKGRTMPLSSFYRIARNTMMMCFGSQSEDQSGPSTETVEQEFWNHVSKRESHICVHSGSIDSGTHGYGFSIAKNSTFRKHPWNLKVLTNNSSSILRFLGPLMGVTVPTLHVGMLYSAFCWYRDPHGLPWIEYLHTGADKIWYGIPDHQSEKFKETMLKIVPRFCRDKKIWLSSDTVMIPPPLLTAHDVSLSRVVQKPGQFIVVFPKAFTSSISTGYLVSESVYFAQASWLDSAKQIFMDLQDSCEPPVFSLEQLLLNIADDTRASLSILLEVLPLLIEIQKTELSLRAQLKERGVNTFEKLEVNKKRKSKTSFQEEDYYECDICHANLFVSLVTNTQKQNNYCLKHAVTTFQKKSMQVKHCKLLYAYTEEELEELIEKVKSRIETKSVKKSNK